MFEWNPTRQRCGKPSMDIETHSFVVLARDVGSEARGRLLSILSCEVLDAPDPAPSELAVFFEISRILIEQADRIARRAFSEKIADREKCPHDSLLRLAGDEISVAEPVLVRAMRLAEDDLIELASRFGGGHRAAIALRRDLTPLLARTLLQAGEREVYLRLGANRAIALDAEMLRFFRLRAETDERLREILGARPEYRAATKRGSGEIDRRNARSPHVPEGGDDVAVLFARLKRGETSVDAVVIDLADADRQADLVAFFGRLAGIDQTGVMRVLVRRDVEGVATLAGGLGIGEASFARIVELRRRRLGFSASQAKWERESYHRVDQAQARATLEQVGGRRRTA